MPPRYADVDEDGLRRTIAEQSELLAVYPRIDDPRNFDAFLTRGQARWAAGDPVKPVADDLRCAGICLTGQARVRFYKMEPHRLRSRRIDPIHLALLHASPDHCEGMARDYGLPLMTVYADAANPDLEREVLPMSSYFRSQTFGSPADIAGFAAASYAAVLASLVRGDDAEAAGLLRLLGGGLDQVTVEPPASAKRYLIQCEILADVLGRRAEEVGGDLAALLPFAQADRERALGADARAVQCRGDGAPDTTVPALVALCSLVGLEIDLGPVRAADPAMAELCSEVQRTWAQVE